MPKEQIQKNKLSSLWLKSYGVEHEGKLITRFRQNVIKGKLAGYVDEDWLDHKVRSSWVLKHRDHEVSSDSVSLSPCSIDSM